VCSSARAGGERSRERQSRARWREQNGVEKRWIVSRDFYAAARKCRQFRRNSRAIRTFLIHPFVACDCTCNSLPVAFRFSVLLLLVPGIAIFL